MITTVDDVLDRITMYRLVLYVLVGYVGVATILAYLALLPFPPLALLISAAFLVIICWAANGVMAWAFDVPTNVESAMITGLILALIIDPARSLGDLQFLGWAAILAMASKYILALNNKHVFNPAAIAVAITALALGETASWWLGTVSMLPVVLLGGLLIVRKMRQEDMAVSFLAAALVTVCGVSLLQRTAVPRQLDLLLAASPLFFVASVMLTEPRTAPPTRNQKRLYGLLVGVLVVPQIHVGSLYSTPELALIAGNAAAYLVSPRRSVTLKLRRKTRLSPDIVDFVFTPSRQLSFAPGQYIECTLAHPHSDSRGNRRFFSIASSPTEETVRLGVRLYPRSSSYKTALFAMNAYAGMIGGQIAGDFTLPAEHTQRLVFIAGGVGITPFRSMLKYLVDSKQRRDIILIYAGKTPADLVYRDIVGEAQSRVGIRVAYTLTDSAAVPANWSGNRGRIDAEMIRQTVPDLRERIYYLSGPPDMVTAHRRVLRTMGIKRHQIKTDYFYGLV